MEAIGNMWRSQKEDEASQRDLLNPVLQDLTVEPKGKETSHQETISIL